MALWKRTVFRKNRLLSLETAAVLVLLMLCDNFHVWWKAPGSLTQALACGSSLSDYVNTTLGLNTLLVIIRLLWAELPWAMQHICKHWHAYTTTVLLKYITSVSADHLPFLWDLLAAHCILFTDDFPWQWDGFWLLSPYICILLFARSHTFQKLHINATTNWVEQPTGT